MKEVCLEIEDEIKNKDTNSMVIINTLVHSDSNAIEDMMDSA